MASEKHLDYAVGLAALGLGLVAKIAGIDGEFFLLVSTVAGLMFGLGIKTPANATA